MAETSDPRRTTVLCVEGNHRRCPGNVLVVTAGEAAFIARCECTTCQHRGDRRLPYEQATARHDD